MRTSLKLIIGAMGPQVMGAVRNEAPAMGSVSWHMIAVSDVEFRAGCLDCGDVGLTSRLQRSSGAVGGQSFDLRAKARFGTLEPGAFRYRVQVLFLLWFRGFGAWGLRE